MRKKPIRILLIVLPALCVLLLAAFLLFRHWQESRLIQVEPPSGAQLLTFPIDSGIITAGYRNARYLQKNGYAHYGTDVTGLRSNKADVLASGAGVVLGSEFCENSVGNIAVIRYEDVFVPQSGETRTLIARYYHMTAITISPGDTVAPGQVIGFIDRSHKWYHHIHIELDTDLDYPFNTPQVADASSSLLNRYPASGESIINPLDVLVVGKKQRQIANSFSECCTVQDTPRYAEKR